MYRACFLLLLFTACITDNYVDRYDAQRRINAVLTAKYKQCSQPVTLLVFVPFDQQEGDVRSCEAEILATACPLNRMPASCFLLLLKKAPHEDIDP